MAFISEPFQSKRMARIEDSRFRQRAERLGRRGEILASLILMMKGYRILGRRVRTRLGEIDLIARSPSGILCFIEVKFRALGDMAIHAVTPRQQVRIARAAELYVSQRPGLGSKGVRFDIVTWGAKGFPKHVRDAWRPSS